MLTDKLKKYRIILASQSPRRQQLLKGLNIDFEVIVREVDEVFPPDIKREEIPRYLCELKAKAFAAGFFTDNEIVITADTIVWINDKVLGKPKSFEDAVNIIKELSGNKHEVITGVCLKSKNKTHIFHAESDVYFRDLSDEEIRWYVENYKPYDKAGAYGVQEWIGYIAIERIEGSYFNVMGLPTQKLYLELEKYIDSL
jgi:septum formation protein